MVCVYENLISNPIGLLDSPKDRFGSNKLFS